MQLKLRRSQREAGVLSTSVIFCLDARADLSDRERSNLARYKLYDQVIYNSEASRRHLERGEAAGADGSVRGGLKALMHTAMAALQLNITVRGLERGQHIECKSMDELLAAEDAIMEACRNLKAYLDRAATFDGGDLLYDFSGDEPVLVAQTFHPEPILAPPPSIAIAASEPHALAAPEEHGGYDSGDPGSDRTAYGYAPRGNMFGAVVDAVSEATGLDYRSAKRLAIGIAVFVLLLLLAMCHG